MGAATSSLPLETEVAREATKIAAGKVENQVTVA